MSKNLQKYREDLHQIPEIFFQEFKTKEYLQTTLTNMGYTPIEVLETGLLVYIDNNNSETIAFRSDIDALQVQEETDVTFASKHEGYMHACGHDGHMSMLLGLADYLKDKQTKLKKNILLVFQPAEESIGGAKLIIRTGVFKKYNVTKIFGIHLYPLLDEGIVASKENEFMAMANEINITIHGKSAHGAMPHLGVDSNIILSKLLIEFENIQSRIISPLEYTIITFGRIEGGNVRNVLSDYARMEGTIRSFSLDTFNAIKHNIETICKHYEHIYNCTIELDINEGYLPVINESNLYKEFKEIVTKHFPYYEFEKPLMIAEDFSYYQEELPGVFYYIGTKNEELDYVYGLHHPKFNFTVKALETGLKTYITLIKEMGVIDE